jgi:hypothetical protein
MLIQDLRRRALLVALGGAALVAASPGSARSNAGKPDMIVVFGVVEGVNGALAGATVFLKDSKKGGAVRSYTTTPDGSFRFTQVWMGDDYQLWARWEGKKSAIKTVSSWDTRREAGFTLMIR